MSELTLAPPAATPAPDPDPATPAPAAASGSTLARVLRARQVRVGLGLMATMIAVALAGPLFAPHDPNEPVGMPYSAPGGGFPFGTDQLGRDVLSRVLAGGQHLAWMAPLAALASVFCGAVVGVVAAYRGGKTDIVLMRLMDVLLAFPALVFTLLFVSVVGPKPWLLVLLVVIGSTPGVARVLRGAALPLREREHVLWAVAVGLPARRILLREYLPNIWSPLMVEFGMRLMWSIGILASMSFIGYGIQPPDADWGLMVSENRTGMYTQPWAVLAPTVMIVLFTVGGNLIAEGSGRVVARTEGAA
jgi:peptide/nickel transport system permease protein